MTLARMKTVEGCHVSARRPASTQRRTRYVYRPNLTCHSRQTLSWQPCGFRELLAPRNFAAYISRLRARVRCNRKVRSVTDVTSLWSKKISNNSNMDDCEMYVYEKCFHWILNEKLSNNYLISFGKYYVTLLLSNQSLYKGDSIISYLWEVYVCVFVLLFIIALHFR